MSKFSRWNFALVLPLLLTASLFAEQPAGVGIPRDWSHSHIAIHQSAAVGTQVFSRDPRMLTNFAARASVAHAAPPAPVSFKTSGKSKRMSSDWSVSFRGGSVAAAMFPAKFSFYTSNPVTAANCTTDYVVYGLNVPGVSGATVATISSISRTTNVVTVTTAAAHGLVAGERVTINGVTNSGFNGNFAIVSAPTATTFTYSQTASNAASSGGTVDANQANLVALNNLYSGTAPAGNNGLCGSGSFTITATGASRVSNVVTITTSAAHTFLVGNSVTITGVINTGFNGTFKIASVPSATTFTFAQTGPNASSGSGAVNIAAGTYFAYNASSATCGGTVCPTGGIFTSPAISFDSTGAKIAFVESVSDSTATCPARVGTGACSIFHVLQWTANEGSIGSPMVPGQGGSTASMASITYASATNTTSSPWIDYSNDAAYIGADDGKLYRITGVFNGTPTLDTTFGDVAGTAGVTITAGQRLSPPVELSGVTLNSGYIFLGDALGNVKALGVSNHSIIGTVLVGGGGINPTVLDPVILFYDSVSNPNYISVFAVTSSTNGGFVFPSGVVSPNHNRGALIQMLLDITGPSFAVASGIDTGKGANGPVNINYHSGAFDNTFYNTPTSGFMYVCGNGSSQPQPVLYRVAFNNALPAPKNLVPTISTSTQTPAIVAANVDCSPLTEFANPSLTNTDQLFFSTGSGTAYTWNISGALQTTPVASLTETGGTSGIVVDNSVLTSGNGTSQGSSIYFTTMATSAQCGAGSFCAVKLRQADLQ